MSDSNQPPHDDETADDLQSSGEPTLTRNSIPTDEVDSHQPPPPSAAAQDAIHLYLPGRDQPSTFKDKDVITLGRPDPVEDFYPTMDLTEDSAILLGVSRQHAQIRREDGAYYIEDLNSTNGTWLNDEKLEPHQPARLRSNDHVRLAHLVLIVYLG